MDSRISIDPKICYGKPVIRGTRVLISNILASLATGATTEEVMEDYPNLKKEDILSALAFSCELSSFEAFSYEPIFTGN